MRIALLGDVALFGRYSLQHGRKALEHLDRVADFLQGFDYVVANLETPFVDGSEPVGAKSAHIKSAPGDVAILKRLGINVVNFANNHIVDYGVDGYEKTKSLLKDAGIDWFGSEGRGVRIDHAGEKVAFLGYCSLNTNPLTLKIGEATAPNILDVDSVFEEMDKNNRDGYLSILSIHSGQEHIHIPSSDDVTFARSLASRFNYVYYGHHPHVVQGVEQINNSPIFYSLGNFLFDDVYTPRDAENPLIRLSEENKTGVIASVEIEDGMVVRWNLTPIYMGQDAIRVGAEVPSFTMSEYNNALAEACTQRYDLERGKIINAYIESRRALRNLKWYVRRLNANSVGVILAARRNARMHQRLFVSKLMKLREG